MATSAEIKSNNNALIRAKTVAKSITKQSVADQLDAGIDYTVQEISTLSGVVSGKELLTNKSIDIIADGSSDTKYPSVKAVKTYVDANAGGLTFVSVDSNSFSGNGTPSSPLKNKDKVYYRTGQIYASGGNAPFRVKNFFNGMQLPDGVTETFTRVSSGIYRANYSGADTIADLDLSDFSKLFHFNFSSMPTNTGSDLKIQQIGSTNTGGIITIFVEFHNLPSGVLTDNFNGYLYYEVKFFQ